MTRAALLAIAEGTASLAGQDAVRRLMSAVTERLPDVDVRLGYANVQEPDLAAALASVPAGAPVVVVTLALFPEHPMHVDVASAIAAHPEVHLAGALGPDPRIARMLARRLREQRADIEGPDASDAVVLALAGAAESGSGPRQAAQLQDELGHSVRLGYLTAAQPRIADAVAAARARLRPDGSARRVVVASGVLTVGFLHDIVTRAGGDIVTRPLLDTDAPATELVELIVDRYRDALDGPMSSAL
jgi:sirohydrochlorin ferrochelatase